MGVTGKLGIILKAKAGRDSGGQLPHPTVASCARAPFKCDLCPLIAVQVEAWTGGVQSVAFGGLLVSAESGSSSVQ